MLKEMEKKTWANARWAKIEEESYEESEEGIDRVNRNEMYNMNMQFSLMFIIIKIDINICICHVSRLPLSFFIFTSKTKPKAQWPEQVLRTKGDREQTQLNTGVHQRQT